MAHDLISGKTRTEFREHFTAKYLAVIDDAFRNVGIQCDLQYEPPVTGERRARVEQYYRTVQWDDWGSVSRVLRVYEHVLVDLEIAATRGGQEAEYAKRKLPELLRWLQQDGIKYEGGRLLPPATARLPGVRRAAAALDAPELHAQIDRMTASVEHDPALAIGTAKELIESTCKTILEARDIGFDHDADVPQLVKLVRKELKLLPEDIPQSAKGADSIRRLLGSLGTTAAALAELRNLYGTGHGRGSRSGGVKPRHARLAVGSAATLATFLFETHSERQAEGDNPTST